MNITTYKSIMQSNPALKAMSPHARANALHITVRTLQRIENPNWKPLDEYAHDLERENSRLKKIIDLAIDTPKNKAVSYDQNLDNYTEADNNTIHPQGGMEDENMPSKFRARVKIGLNENSEPLYKWACGNTPEELQRSIARIINESAEKEAKGNVPLWEEYGSMWFETFKRPMLREGTGNKQRSRLDKQVLPRFKGRRLDEITTYDVMQSLNASSELGQSYLRDIMSMMKNIFKSAVEDGYINKNPMDSSRVVNPSKKKPVARRALTIEQQNDIIQHISGLKKVEDRRFMAFLMFTCLNPSEILGLKWEDFNFDDNTVHIQRGLTFSNGKGILGDPKEESRNRHVPFEPEFVEYLQPIQNEGFVFARTRKGFEGQYYSEQTAQNQWNRIKKQIDVHGMVPYEGRHTFATNMLRANVPMTVAVKMIGHVDERMLVRNYQHPDTANLKEAVKMVSNLVSKVQSV